MPNHVINEIVLHGVSLDRCRDKIVNPEGRLDFSILVPLPINFWAGSVGKEHEESFPGSHLDAARAQWGTKWNAYGLDDDSVAERDGSTVLTFQTAWSHPRGWTVAIFNTFRCDITASWLSEGGWAGRVESYRINHGIMGDDWQVTTVEEGSDEYRRLHKLLWGVEEFEDEAEA